jgi:hypothetical protein
VDAADATAMTAALVARVETTADRAAMIIVAAATDPIKGVMALC